MAKFVNQGFSISDLLIWLAVLSVLVTLSLKFIPPYIEHRTALSIVRDLVMAEEAGKMDISALEDRLNKNLKVNSLSKFQQAKRIVLDAQGQTITAKLEYEVRGQLFANVDYVIVFDDALVVKD
ncbi:MAG: hypothetical protein CMP96_04525 [Gammaproteobacteria bacterium]|nr:hypothetical protein [Gammaproteobacteria bacterium]